MVTVCLSFLLAEHILWGSIKRAPSILSSRSIERPFLAFVPRGPVAQGVSVSPSPETNEQQDFGRGDLSDRQVLEGFLQGDGNLAAEFVRRHGDPLYGFIRRVTTQPADAYDLFQETILRDLRLGRSFTGRSSLKTWLHVVALNVCRDHVQGGRNAHASLYEQVTPAPGRTLAPDCVVEREEIGARVRELLGKLPREQREVVILKYYQGFTFEEIAEVGGCPVATAKSRMRLAVSRIRPGLKRLSEAYDTAPGDPREGTRI